MISLLLSKIKMFYKLKNTLSTWQEIGRFYFGNSKPKFYYGRTGTVRASYIV